MCPICGFDLVKSAVIQHGSFLITPTGQVYYDSKFLPFTMQQAQFIYTVAKADGKPIDKRLILERISDVEFNLKLIDVVYSHIKAKFVELGIENPIYNIHGIGLAWRKEPG